ncbi:MAG: PHP domain-containing protein [Deltaproteobacteria bacterium]|nr:PHP domain-containing protein [Deltaproteobacteria bacterium]
MTRAITLAVLACALAGCSSKQSCLEGTCPAPCADLAFVCEPRDTGPLYLGRAADAPLPLLLTYGHAADADILISNGIVTAVISTIDAPNDLAPTGGVIIDYGPAGGADDLTVIYQLAGILPDDAFAYTTLETSRDADAVRVTVRGTLDGRPEVRVVTHYELRACDLGVRVRSELFNGSVDTQAFMIADASHWGKRRVAPFAPAVGQGYETPELELLELAALWKPLDFSAGANPSDDGPGYGIVACDRPQVSGVNDAEISALGTPMKVVEPGDTLVLERLIVTADAGRGPARAIDAMLAARAQLFDAPTTQVAGRVLAGGMPFGGDVRRASVLIRVAGRPVTSVVPDDDGRFTVTVPDRRDDGSAIVAEVWSFGRKLVEGTARGGNFGDLVVPLPATLQVAVTTASIPSWATIVLHPADAATRTAVTGSFHGRFGDCAPWLGPAHGRSPACNRALVDPQGSELEVPAGRYQVFATAGPEHQLAMQEVELRAGEITTVAIELAPLDVAPAGWLSADLHVHGRASFDSSIPDDDRVKSFLAAGVDVIAATDHDVIGDYARTVSALGVGDQVAVMGGLEATQIIPWLDVPGEDVPRVIGHFNFWPLVQVPGAAGAGAPSDEYLEPGALFDRMAPLVGADGMMMLNHPWDEPLFGRDLGYLRAIEFDPRVPIGDASPLLRRPAGGHRNLDWNLIEIINGADASEIQKARGSWFALLAQGHVVAGAGNSDSHGLTDQQLGWARNWVAAEGVGGPMTVATFDATRFDAALRDGRLVAGNGIVVTATVGAVPGLRRNVGLAPYTPAPGDVLEINVRAPPWVPVEEVRVITSKGTTIVAAGPALLRVTDPFGTAGVQRYQAFLEIAELVDRDDFIIVEAGMAYPRAADLDDDGVPDTTDNNGDGVIDDADVEEDEDVGPLTAGPDPEDPAHPRWAVTRVIPGAVPMGFTNPILVDLDGAGWTPPGLR